MQKFEINGIETTLINTDKFKTITFFVVFLGEFNKEVATQKSLLSLLLSGSTKKYQTKKQILNKLFSLYDASISINNYPIYKTNISTFSLNIINPKFVESENLLPEAMAFLYEFIFNPNIDNDGFSENEFNEKRRILRDNINNIYNNKSLYAFNRLLQEMGKDEIISVSAMGTIEDLEKITRVNICDHYQKMINEEQVQIYVIGDITQAEVEACFQNFPLKNNYLNLETVTTEHKIIGKINEVIEKQDINQAKLMLGFRTNVNARDELYIPMTVFNMMFGGMGTSDLFRVVREENSLAYSVDSSIFFDTAVMVVSVGIDSKDYHLASDLIIKELERYKQGKINDKLIKIAKDNLISNINQMVDNPYANLNFVLKNNLLNKKTAEEIISVITNVSREDIIEASQKITLDTIYCLQGEAHG